MFLIYLAPLIEGHSGQWKAEQNQIDHEDKVYSVRADANSTAQAASYGDELAQDIETSASLLVLKSHDNDKLTTQLANKSNLSDRPGKMSKQASNKNPTQSNVNNSKEHSTNRKIIITATSSPQTDTKDPKKTKIKLFSKNSNFSFIALLPKSKRLDNFNATSNSQTIQPKASTRKTNHSVPFSLHQQPFEPIIFSPMASQTIMHPYGAPTSAHPSAAGLFLQPRPSDQVAGARLFGPTFEPPQSATSWTQVAPSFHLAIPDVSNSNIAPQTTLNHKATQGVESFNRLLFNQQHQQAIQNEPIPFFYHHSAPNSDQEAGVSPTLARPTNHTSVISSALKFPLFSSSQSPTSSKPPQMGPNESPVAQTASLIGERAKALLSQLDLTNLSGDNSSSRLARHLPFKSQPKLAAGAGDMNNDLSSSTKSLADNWASASTEPDSTPTIIFEHDGPTLTTVDFGLPPTANRIPVEAADPSDDEEISNFYSEDSEEAEQEGSNEAKRFAAVHNRQPSMNFYETLPEENSVGNDFYEPKPRTQQASKSSRRPNSYPDSISAIKEQGRSSERTQYSKSKLASSDSDQIEKLIRDLQELKRRRTPDREEAKKREPNDNSGDDYGELLGSNDEDDDDQIRLLRKKLMARLNSKRDRQTLKSISEDTFHNAAVKIPLHALLMAALDRRMSSSESSGDSLIVDPRNKDVISRAAHEFNEISADLGSVMSDQRQNATASEPHIFNVVDNSSGMKSIPSSQTSEESLAHRVAQSRATPLVQLNISQSLTDNAKENLTSKRKEASPSGFSEDQSSTPTTSSPVALMQQSPVVQGAWMRQDRFHSAMRPVYTFDERDDFDLNRHVREFSSERNEPRLEPSWVSRQAVAGNRRGHDNELAKAGHLTANVNFDDEFDDMDRSTRRKLFRRRRLSTKTANRPKPHRRNTDVDEDRFLTKLNRDLLDDDETTSVDRNVDNMDNSEESAGAGARDEARSRRRAKALKKRGELDEGDEAELDSGNEPQVRSGDPEFDSDEPSQPRPRKRSGSSRKNGAQVWKPKVIDDEVRKMEIQADQRDRGQQHSGSNADDASEAQDEPEVDEAESRVNTFN